MRYIPTQTNKYIQCYVSCSRACMTAYCLISMAYLCSGVLNLYFLAQGNVTRTYGHVEHLSFLFDKSVCQVCLVELTTASLLIRCVFVSVSYHYIFFLVFKRQVLVRWTQLRTQQARIRQLRHPLRRRQVRVLWRVIRFQCVSVHRSDIQGLLHGFQVSSRNGIYDHQQ